MLFHNAIVKLTTGCNLNCKYCNVEKNKREDFPADEIDELVDTLAQQTKDICSVLWHGGEPLILGLDYLDRIITSEERYPGKFHNIISTNGILLSDDVVDYLIKNNITIKTSLDNINISKDENRCFSCNKVIEGLNRVRIRKYNDVYVRTTVGSSNEDELWNIYLFMKEAQCFKWEFAPIIPAGLKAKEAFELLPDADTFSAGIIRIFHDWFDNCSFDIPVFNELIKIILGFTKAVDVSKPRINIGHDGYVYRCPLLIGNDKFIVGEYTDPNTWKQFYTHNCIWNTLKYSKCENCHHVGVCRVSKCSYMGESLKCYDGMGDYYCKMWKPVFDDIEMTLKTAF